MREKKINGKPMSHWRREAKSLVIEVLVRGAGCDSRSIIGKLASERLMFLAQLEDDGSGLLQEILQQRDNCRRNLAVFVASLAPDPPKAKKKKRA